MWFGPSAAVEAFRWVFFLLFLLLPVISLHIGPPCISTFAVYIDFPSRYLLIVLLSLHRYLSSLTIPVIPFSSFDYFCSPVSIQC
jgi:hypothetical protein